VPAQLGLPQLVTREISVAKARGDQARVRNVTAWFTFAVMIGATVMFAVGIAGYLLWPQKGNEVHAGSFYWGMGNIPVIALVALGMGILRGLHQVVRAQLYDAVLRPGFMFASLLAVVALKQVVNADTALAIQVTTGALAAVLCAVHIARTMPAAVYTAATGRFDRALVKGAAPMTGTEILRVIDGQYPILLLGLLAPISDVGLYRVAMGAAAFISLPGTLMNLVVMPHVARFHAIGDKARLQRIAQMSSLFCFTSTAGMTLGVLLVGKPLLARLFGQEYAGSWTPLLLIGLAYIVNGFFGCAAIILNMCGQERNLVVAFLLSPIVGILFTAILYPAVGISAAAIAMIISQACQGAYMYAIARKHLKIHLSMLSFRIA
jgi:O-antigen/teichoic acid export membrane protein